MDRFTRTREYYLRGSRNEDGEHREPTGAPAPPAVARGFDFDFAESKLDLSLGIGLGSTGTPPHPRLEVLAGQIGIAISDDVENSQRARLRKRQPDSTLR